MLVVRAGYQLAGGYHTRRTAQVMSRIAVHNEPPSMTYSRYVYK